MSQLSASYTPFMGLTSICFQPQGSDTRACSALAINPVYARIPCTDQEHLKIRLVTINNLVAITLPLVTLPLVTLSLVTLQLVTLPLVTLPLVTLPLDTLPLVTLPLLLNHYLLYR
jgi:hypothetical protein